jgi:hypothetical protein
VADFEQTIIDPAVLVELAPSLDEAEADRLLRFAARAVRAYAQPLELDEGPPVPLPLEQVLLAHALRLGRANATPAGELVSESIGAYTYRLARSLPLDATLELDDNLKAAIDALLGRTSGAYEMDLGGSPAVPFVPFNAAAEEW